MDFSDLDVSDGPLVQLVGWNGKCISLGELVCESLEPYVTAQQYLSTLSGRCVIQGRT
jgi:hypothetical protein